VRARGISGDIEAGVTWAGDIAPLPNLIACGCRWRHVLRTKSGTAERNPVFRATISPTICLTDFSGLVALHQSNRDVVEPAAWPETAAEALQAVDNPLSALILHPGDNSNISISRGVAGQRAAAFFDRYVRGESE